jgi:2-amino-4-hydroxy-6-hydroxymethyldihydropteridine diphosphokinase
MLENQVKIAYLSIGSNLGSKVKNIEFSKFKLRLNNINILKTSSYYESVAWPNPKNPKFFNIIIKISTNYSPKKLLMICNKIEKELGRKRLKKNCPRTCDIDIIDFDKKIMSSKITLPHPLMSKRNFVLFPLYEIEKLWKHPKTNINITKLIGSLPIGELRSIKQI